MLTHTYIPIYAKKAHQKMSVNNSVVSHVRCAISLHMQGRVHHFSAHITSRIVPCAMCTSQKNYMSFGAFYIARITLRRTHLCQKTPIVLGFTFYLLYGLQQYKYRSFGEQIHMHPNQCLQGSSLHIHMAIYKRSTRTKTCV